MSTSTSMSMGAQAATCTITDSEARHSTELTRRKRGFGRWVKLKTPRGKSSPVRVTCKNLATNEITGKDSTPIDATGTENVGAGARTSLTVNTTSLVALEVDANEGATNNVLSE